MVHFLRGGIWSADLSLPGGPLPGWMMELAEQVRLIEPGTLLPTGVIVGSAVVPRPRSPAATLDTQLGSN